MLLTYSEPISFPAEYSTKHKVSPTTSEEAHSKQLGQEMLGYLHLPYFVSGTPQELLPSSQKTQLKGKDSFLSVFGLCTETEIACSPPAQLTNLCPSTHALPKAGDCIFC